MKHATKYFAILGILLFSFLLYKIGIADVFGHIKQANPFYLLLGAALIIPSIVLRALRWRAIIQAFGHRYTLFRSSAVFLIGLFFSELTPGRAGDAVRALYLKKEMHSFGKSLSTIFIDRLYDIFVTVSLAIYAILSLSLLSEQNIVGIISMAGIILALPFLLLHEGLVRRFLRPLYKRFIPIRFKETISHAFNEFYRGVSIVRKKRALTGVAFLLTFTGWCVSVLQAYVVSKALHLDISFLFLLGVVPLITLLSVVPITVSGLGTREAGYVVLFGLLGIDPSAAVAYSLMFAAVTSWLPAAVGAFAWTLRPINLADLKKSEAV